MDAGMMNLSSAPHVRDKWTTPFIMRVVFLSLMPATIVGCVVYGWHAAAIVAVSIVSERNWHSTQSCVHMDAAVM